jgi:hypothetical protein
MRLGGRSTPEKLSGSVSPHAGHSSSRAYQRHLPPSLLNDVIACLLEPVAGYVEFHDHAVVHEAVDRRGRRHQASNFERPPVRQLPSTLFGSAFSLRAK